MTSLITSQITFCAVLSNELFMKTILLLLLLWVRRQNEHSKATEGLRKSRTLNTSVEVKQTWPRMIVG